eukprot:s370_g29.t1
MNPCGNSPGDLLQPEVAAVAIDFRGDDLESPAAAASVAPTAPTARWLRLERSAKQRLSGLRVVWTIGMEKIHEHSECSILILPNMTDDSKRTSATLGIALPSSEVLRPSACSTSTRSECIRTLQAAGFGVWAAVPPSRGTEDAEQPLDRLPFEMPTALLFGSEARGVSAAALSMCDGRFTVPLSGLSESLGAQGSPGKLMTQREASLVAQI